MEKKSYGFLLLFFCLIGIFTLITLDFAFKPTALSSLPADFPSWLIPLSIGFFLLLKGLVAYLMIYFAMKFATKLGFNFLLLQENVSYFNDIIKPGVSSGLFCAFLIVLVNKINPIYIFPIPLFAKIYALANIIPSQITGILYFSGVALLLRNIFKNLKISSIMLTTLIFTSFVGPIGYLPIPSQLEQTLIESGVHIFGFSWVQFIINTITVSYFGALYWRKGFEVAVVAHLTIVSVLYFVL